MENKKWIIRNYFSPSFKKWETFTLAVNRFEIKRRKYFYKHMYLACGSHCYIML